MLLADLHHSAYAPSRSWSRRLSAIDKPVASDWSAHAVACSLLFPQRGSLGGDWFSIPSGRRQFSCKLNVRQDARKPNKRCCKPFDNRVNAPSMVGCTDSVAEKCKIVMPRLLNEEYQRPAKMQQQIKSFVFNQQVVPWSASKRTSSIKRNTYFKIFTPSQV